MSAWIVTDKHISYMVNAAISYNRRMHRIAWGIDGERVEAGNQNDVALGLINENVKSVNYRDDDATPARCSFRLGAQVAPDPVWVIKAVHCYEYQSCEHPEWAGSRAWFFCKHLKEAASRELPGYEEAPWGID